MVTAERRMFSKSIVQGGRFLRMPVSSRELYFQLGMSADDDGIVEAWSVMKLTNAHEDDLRVLVSKGFVQILNGEDLIAYLTDWSIHNTIRKDRYHESLYKDLKLQLADGNQMTTNCQPTDNQLATTWQPDVNQCETEVRLGKDRLGKDSVGKERGAGETRTTTPKKRKTSVDLFNELENGRLSAVFASVLKWMQYKDESGKPYKTETGMKSFITQVEKHLRKYGAAAVNDCIELSMSNNYQGIVWDRIREGKNNGNSNWFLEQLQKGEMNDNTGDIQDSGDPQGGISGVLPGIDGW